MNLKRRRERDSSRNSISAGSAASGATFEFDMGVVRDSEHSLQRRRSRRSRIGIFSSSNEASSRGSQHYRDSADNDSAVGPDVPREISDSQEGQSSTHSSTRSFADSWTSGAITQFLPSRTITLALLIGFLGFISSTLFLGFGIARAVEDQDRIFRIRANELIHEMESVVQQYIIAAQWVHQACAFHEITREEFHHVSEYLDTYLDLKAVEWLPKIYDNERMQLEEESRDHYSNVSDVEYLGFVGMEPIDPEQPSGPYEIAYRSQQEYYYPVHFIEPIDEYNIPLIDFDVASSPVNYKVIRSALQSKKPAASPAYNRPSLNGGVSEDKVIQIVHPGFPLLDGTNQSPQDVAAIVVRIKTLLEAATVRVPNDISMFLYDSTEKDQEPEFLLGVELYLDGDEETGEREVYLEEISLTELEIDTVFFTEIQDIQVASRTWSVVVVALEDTILPNFGYVILSGKFIMIASLCVSLWIWTNFRRTRTVLELKRKSEMEKTQVIVRSAREKAKAEQELNDYIAHEIRNPPCTFVKSTVNEKTPSGTPAFTRELQEDVDIIDSSLAFTHDLLRSMLDMHRAASKELIIEESPLDVKRDVVDPVVAMLYKRGLQFEIISECPENLMLHSDGLRLKQILLNLCRNATRFVVKGYVKIGVEIVEGSVQFYVEDSGFGISDKRKKHLFEKFQESLEVMDQGSGVGLCLCKSMSSLLKADLWLDESFDSGVVGFPGTKFVLDMKKSPLNEADLLKSAVKKAEQDNTTTPDTYHKTEAVSKAESAEPPEKSQKGSSVEFQAPKDENPNRSLPKRSSSMMEDAVAAVQEIRPLPDNLSVLFVDDDTILRKLFIRSLKKVTSTWDLNDAASGEAALKAVEEKDYDIIFMDQYMSSVEKQLLGTETTKELRSRGVKSRICGLSANDVGDAFWTSGADYFMLKPFPCKGDPLRAELWRVLEAPRNPLVGETKEESSREGSEAHSSVTQSTLQEEDSEERKTPPTMSDAV